MIFEFTMSSGSTFEVYAFDLLDAEDKMLEVGFEARDIVLAEVKVRTVVL